MAASAVNTTIEENGLGASAPSPKKRVCVIGRASSGTDNVPAKFAKVQALIDAVGVGAGVECAAELLNAGAEVVFVKCDTSTAPEELVADATITATALGSSTVTASGTANDDYSVVFLVTKGGTRGTTGIKFKVSLDGGKTYGGIVSLGTATTYAIPNSGITLHFAAGTLTTDGTATFSVRAATSTSADVMAALNAALALGSQSMQFAHVLIDPPMDRDIADDVKTAIEAERAKNHFVSVLSNFRKQDVGESMSDWQTAFVTAFDSFECYQVLVGFGCGQLTSVISKQKQLRPAALAVAMRAAITKISESPAYVDRGATRFSIVDSETGALLAGVYDERVYGTMNDERAVTLRSFTGRNGSYITGVPTMAGPSSQDFAQWMNVRVVFEAARISTNYLTGKLNKDVRVDESSGFILEADALTVEKGCDDLLKTGLIKTANGDQDATNAHLVLSRTDNILAGADTNADLNIIPLGYFKNINLKISLVNPANAVAAAAPPAA